MRNDANRGSGMYNSRDDDSRSVAVALFVMWYDCYVCSLLQVVVEKEELMYIPSSLQSMSMYANLNTNNTQKQNSLPTIDPDYNPASDNFSLSDAGGTIGSQSQSLSVFGSSQQTRNSHHLYNHNTTYQPQPYPQTSTYNASSYKQHHQQQLEPKLLEIYAPSGKLGVVIDVPLNSPTPLVHAIKDSCPIRNEISVGDALIAVDDVDVRNMNAVQVSKLISRKSGQEVRKLSLLRRQQYPSDQLMNIGIVSGEDVYGLR
jgi:hypothetical protein